MAKIDKTQSNRDHHFQYWKDSYGDYQYEMAGIYEQAGRLIHKIECMNRTMINVEANRRENAVSMGVSILESDEAFNLKKTLGDVPALAKEIRDTFAAMGISI